MTRPPFALMAGAALHSPAAMADLPAHARCDSPLTDATKCAASHSLQSVSDQFRLLPEMRVRAAAPRKLQVQAGVGDWGTDGSKVFGVWPKFEGFSKLLNLNGSTGNNVVSSKMPQVQGANPADVAQPGPEEPVPELVRLPSPDVLSALRLVSSLILETNVTESRPVEALRKGCLIQNKRIYRQAFVIRYSEVGADKAASIETLTNLFQVTAVLFNNVPSSFPLHCTDKEQQ